jgi:hypothetical protein
VIGLSTEEDNEQIAKKKGKNLGSILLCAKPYRDIAQRKRLPYH